MRKVKYYKCPECGKKFKTLSGWSGHMDMMHPSARPEGFSDSRFFYYILTGKTAGSCIECHSPTDWSEATGKYNRYCNNPACKKAYVKLAKSRMTNKYGKEYLLDDPDMQRKMVSSRKISGYYTFSDGSGKLGYVGSYEKDFLMMMDKFMRYSANDILSPSPNTYFYEYEGKKHFYIPDFYVPNLNLEIEIKASDNTHPKIQAVDKVKERLKDEVMQNNPKINYIKINDKVYTGFFDYLLSLKESVDDADVKGIISNTAELSPSTEALDYIDDDKNDAEGEYDPSVYFYPEISLSPATEAVGDTNTDKRKKPIIFIFEASNIQNGFINYDQYEKFKVYNPFEPATQYEIVPDTSGTVTKNGVGSYVTVSNFPDENDNTFECLAFSYFVDDVVHERFFEKLRKCDSVHNPLSYAWDSSVRRWLGHSDKFRFFCYSFVQFVLMHGSDAATTPVPVDFFNPTKIVLVDCGKASDIRIDDLITHIEEWNDAYRDLIHEKPLIEEAVLEDRFYTRMPPALEELFYNNSFTEGASIIDNVGEDEPAEESIQLHTNFDKVKVKGTLSLSKFTKIRITQEILEKYKEKCASFGHCRVSNMSKGYLYVDKKDNIVGFVNVVKKPDGIKWIQALNIQPEYQGYGLYEQLLKVAVRELGGTDISAPPKNDTAKELYRKFGFRTYTDEESVHAMSIRADAQRVKYDAKAKPNATNMTEAGLYPVFVLLTHSKKGFGRVVKFMTHAPYSHASISFDSSMDRLYSFATRDGHTMIPLGLATESLDQYKKATKDATFTLYVKLVDKEDRDLMERKVKEMYNRRTEFRYDVPGVVKNFFGQRSANEKRYFCSGFVAYILNSGKRQVTDKPSDMMRPMDIPDIQYIHLVDMGLIRDYDKNYVDKKVDQIFKKHYMNKEKDSHKQPIDEDEKGEK